VVGIEIINPITRGRGPKGSPGILVKIDGIFTIDTIGQG